MFWSQWCIKLLFSKHIFVWNFLLSNLLINLIYLWISWTDLWILSQTFVTYLEKNHFEKIKFIFKNFYFSFPRRVISRKYSVFFSQTVFAGYAIKFLWMYKKSKLGSILKKLIFSFNKIFFRKNPKIIDVSVSHR